MNELDPKIIALLDSVKDSMSKIEEIERIFKESKEQRNNELLTHLKQLAVFSDTQAIRAKVIRDLYWKKQTSVLLIKEAFGLGVGRIRKIAGTYTIEYPCYKNCGRNVVKTYTARTDLQNFASYKRSAFYNTCDACKEEEKLEAEQNTIEKSKARKQRNNELKAMLWEDFIETEEWIKIRNPYIDEVGYKCELCDSETSSLNVYFHKDTLQGFKNYYSDVLYKYYALCSECIPRCEGLINREKRDTIKREFLSHIKEWNEKYKYGGEY